jgi:hypothetical protein
MAGGERFLRSSKVTAPRQERRAVFHGVADVFTLGLWEVVCTPTGLIFQGEEMALDVGYDENDRIDKVTVLKKK